MELEDMTTVTGVEMTFESGKTWIEFRVGELTKGQLDHFTKRSKVTSVRVQTFRLVPSSQPTNEGRS